MPPRRQSARQASPFYDTTFTLFRISKLSNLPSPLNDQTLRPYARALRDIIRGNVIRGVQLHTDNPEEQRPEGHLARCEWSITPLPKLQAQQDADDDVEDEGEEGALPDAICITLTYDPPATYRTLVVPALDDADAEENGNYPLLLMRMPRAAKEAFKGYFERTFDCYLSPMNIPSLSIKTMLETYMETKVGYARQLGKDSEVLSKADVQVNFSGGPAAPYMRAFNVTLAADDVPTLWDKGVEICNEKKKQTKGKRKRNANDDDDDDDKAAYLFNALREYFRHTMSLETDKLDVVKIACGGFVIGTTRAKIFKGGEVVLRLVIQEAQKRFEQNGRQIGN